MLEFWKRNIKLTSYALKKVKKSFSLAEVLITLGIIGIVAVMTIPTLINVQQQQATLSNLRKTTSIINQAIERSEVDNGMINNWSFPAAGDLSALKTWFDTYLKPYLRYDTITDGTSSIIVKLGDGTDLEFEMTTEMDIIAYFEGYNKAKLVGKNTFYYEILPGASGDAFRPYEVGATGTGRAKWTTGTYACNSSTPQANRRYCAGLIFFDSWQILSDYPW